jgi:hypothetical protein
MNVKVANRLVFNLRRYQMNTLIAELLDFESDRKVSSGLAEVLETWGQDNIQLVSIELFNWLKRQKRFGHEKPMELKQQYAWCKEFSLVIEHWPTMNELFVIEGRQLNFRGTVSANERDQMRQIVFERYQPVLMTKK